MTSDPEPLANMFGDELSPIRKRGKHYVEPRGHAGRAGNGPEGETCGTCRSIARPAETAKPFPKCWKTQASWTRGRASDIRVSDPACEFWEGGNG